MLRPSLVQGWHLFSLGFESFGPRHCARVRAVSTLRARLLKSVAWDSSFIVGDKANLLLREWNALGTNPCAYPTGQASESDGLTAMKANNRCSEVAVWAPSF